LPAARLCQRVAFSIFLCFFLRIRLRRFFMSEPMSSGRLAGLGGSPSRSHRLVGIDHVQLAMPKGQEEVAQGFYEGMLGLERLEKPAPLAARGGCWFSNGQVALHLGVEEDFRPARKAHPAVLVSDLDGLVAALGSEGHGVRFDEEIPGTRRCYVDDPFGNRIELIEC
jgi:catechol 2,3-dioxygenase-like lactoylglutathione lyase family enzyme